MAAWETRLNAEGARLAAEKSRNEALFAKDAEVLRSPDHRIVLAIERQSGNGYWRGPDQVDISFDITVRNTWIYPVTIDKLLVSILLLRGAGSQELAPYMEEHRIEGSSARGIQRKFTWTPTIDPQNALGIQAGKMSVVGFQIRAVAYFLWDGGRFDVDRHLNVTAIVNPM